MASGWECRRTGASGRIDPTQVRVADLSETRVDPFAREFGAFARSKTPIPKVITQEPPQEGERRVRGRRGHSGECRRRRRGPASGPPRSS